MGRLVTFQLNFSSKFTDSVRRTEYSMGLLNLVLMQPRHI